MNLPGHRTGNSSRLARFSGVYVLVALVVVYGLWVPDTFLTAGTAQSILSDPAVTGVVAVGVLFSLSAGAFDLSFANNLGLSSVVCGTLMVTHHWPVWLAIVSSLLIGVVVGVVNGFFVVKIGVDSIIVTLGMASILAALILWLSDGGQFISGLPEEFTGFVTPKIFGIPLVTFYLVLAALIGWYVLEHSPLGRRIQATGSGIDAARLAGVNTGAMTFLAFVITGATASLGGVLITAQIGAVSPNIGSGYLLPVFAAAYLGTTQIKPGRFNVGGTMLALLLLAVGVKGLQLAGGQQWLTEAFNGVALILAVSLAAIGQKRTGVRMVPRLRLRKKNDNQTTVERIREGNHV